MPTDKKPTKPAETKPAEPQAQPVAEAPATEEQTIYHLVGPKGQRWNTTSKAEYNQLTRTRGYRPATDDEITK